MNLPFHRCIARALIAALFLLSIATGVDAGGPLIVNNGVPVLWANHVVRGGPLDSTTVTLDAQGRRTVVYHVDQGPLGPLPNAQGTALVDKIFGQFSNLDTTIRFVDGGPIRDPGTGLPFDVTGSNVGLVLTRARPTFQNPIIFDSDGSILGNGGILGAFVILSFERDGSAVTEGSVILNGLALNELSTTAFIGVFQHEFGHFAGPLDHEQINGNIARWGVSAAVPQGFTTRAQTFDLFAPFIETMFPFLVDAPADSTLRAAGFPDSGYFIATLDMDTKSALASLYPTAGYRATTGSIEGQVFVRGSNGGKIPVDGINVIARRIDRAPYPPAPGTQAFPTPPTLDADGVPSEPPSQPATDSLATASSAVSGVDFGHGTFRIQGLPPGQYEVMLQAINPFAVNGSRIGQLRYQLDLPVLEEYFQYGITSNVPFDFAPVRVQAGKVTTGINLEINGLNTNDPLHATEVPSHLTFATAQDLGPLPAHVIGSVAPDDPFHLLVRSGPPQPVHDLYKFQIATRTVVWMSLEPHTGIGGTGDIDLYLFRDGANPDVVDLFSLGAPRFSATAAAYELIGVSLPPGTWFVGVAGYNGDVDYDLRVMPGVR